MECADHDGGARIRIFRFPRGESLKTRELSWKRCFRFEAQQLTSWNRVSTAIAFHVSWHVKLVERAWNTDDSPYIYEVKVRARAGGYTFVRATY